jgi:ATP-binding protein involved in chromosome partitioning
VSVTKDDVLNSLAKIQTPRGVPLPAAKVLSEITASGDKVFFSLTVDAAEAQAWEAIRAQAEAAVRAIPGIKTVMVALTAERRPGSGPAPGGVKPVASHQHGAGADSPMGTQ